MIGKLIPNRLEAIFTPLHHEIRLAQAEALEKVQKVLARAESEVERKARFMTSEQRFDSAEKELEKAEEQLLSALGSMFKAMCYIAPQINPFIQNPPIKEVKGEVIDKQP